MIRLLVLAASISALAMGAEKTQLAYAAHDREIPSSRENVIRIHVGAMATTKDDALKMGPTVGAELMRYTRSSGVAIGMEVSVLQAGDGKSSLFDGVFDNFSGKEWSNHQTSAIFVLPTLTFRPQDGALRPYLALAAGPALFRQQATNEKTGVVKEADAFRLALVARAGVDIVLADRFSVVVEPLSVSRVASEWMFGARGSLGVNF